jgi:hypothetical protein
MKSLYKVQQDQEKSTQMKLKLFFLKKENSG